MSKGPVSADDSEWIHKQTDSLFKTKQDGIGFDDFLKWAQENLNVNNLLNTFEVVPSPKGEKNLIMETLKSCKLQAGDTYYVLSYRWWESWRHFVNSRSLAHHHQYNQPIINEEEEVDFDNIVNEYLQGIIPFGGNQKQRTRNTSIRKNKKMKASKSQRDTSFKFEDNKDSSMKVQNIDAQFDTQPKASSKRYKFKKRKFESDIIDHSEEKDNTNTKNKKNRFGKPKTSLFKADKKSLPAPAAGYIDSFHDPIEDSKNMSNQFEEGSEINDVPEMPTIRKSGRYYSTIVGDKPNQIDNTDIEGEHEGQLKENIQFKYDYILLPQKAWEMLNEWYGGGPIFARKVIIGKDSQPIVELHPPFIS